eukprot:GFKZ01003009.1.p1 GENE.GFKZ01003009.1~~GFKZ01003009.1.p1  ORF type:complete len:897 (+),score=137.20 GFKZ01003009.1:313-3003(+)
MADIDPNSADPDSQTTGLIINLAIGVPTTLICLLFFEPLRRKVPSIFEARRQLNLAGDPVDYMGNRVATPPPPSYRFFGWLLPTLRLDLDTIADTHGLDAALFLRFQRFMLILFTCMCLPTVVLLPLYYTGPNKDLPDSADAQTRGVNKFSISNLDRDEHWRFWLVLFIEYAITLFICYQIFRQFKDYTRYRRRYRASPHPANYAVIVQDIPWKHCSEEAIHEYWNHIFPGEVAAVFYVQDARKLEKDKDRFWQAVDRRERAEHKLYRRRRRRDKKRDKLERKGKTLKSNYLDESDVDSVQGDGCFFGRCAPRRPDRAVAYWTEQQTRHYAKVVAHQLRREEGDYPGTQSAVVVFNSRRAASVAAQTNFARVESEWRVTRAPEPEAINWGVLAVSGWTKYARAAVTTVLGVAFTLFWVIPVTAIMGFVNLTKLSEIDVNGTKPFAFLRSLADASPVVTGFIESWLPTVVLTVFLSLVPAIFEFFVGISRIVSQARQARMVRDWYFTFVTFSNFLFVAFSGTLLEELRLILQEPAKTVEILARNIPKQAAFMMNFILLTALTETPRELLQIFRVATRFFKLRLTSKTKRQRDKADVGDMSMDYVGFYAVSQLVTLLGLVYCTIQPLIVFCCVGYFAVSYLVFKYNVCYALYNEYQDGGRMYEGALYAVWVGLFVHLLTMIGVYGLNNYAAQSVLIILPAILSALFVIHCRMSFQRVIEHGSALETQDRLEQLEESGGVDSIPAERADLFVHPGFEELPKLDELENLNGIPGIGDGKGGEDDEDDEEMGRIDGKGKSISMMFSETGDSSFDQAERPASGQAGEGMGSDEAGHGAGVEEGGVAGDERGLGKGLNCESEPQLEQGSGSYAGVERDVESGEGIGEGTRQDASDGHGGSNES